jgi:sulfate permease, SulP family
LVAALSIAINIVPAVFMGVAIAVVLFVFRMSRSIVRRSHRCGTIHSRKSRTAPDRAFLERSGDAILVMELQGALFFGTGEKMLNKVETALRRETSCVLLDLRRLAEVDSTGANVLLELKTNLTQRNTKLLLAAAGQTIAMERLENFGIVSLIGDANIVPDADRGIQRAEDDILRTQPQLMMRKCRWPRLGVRRIQRDRPKSY